MWFFYQSPIKSVTSQNSQGSGSFSGMYIIQKRIQNPVKHEFLLDGQPADLTIVFVLTSADARPTLKPGWRPVTLSLSYSN